MWNPLSKLIPFLSSIQWYLAVGAGCLLLGFGWGYMKAHYSCQAQAYKAQFESLQIQYTHSQSELNKLHSGLEKASQQALNAIEELNQHVTNNPVCTIGPDITGVLNRARHLPPSR